jgi:S1-C subfamily serine protease
MKNNQTKYLLLVAVFFSIPSICQGQCQTRCNDYETCDGWAYSARCRVCTYCPPPPSCSCGAVQSSSYLDVLHPGLVLGEADGRVIITRILRGSPALLAGLKPGDEVVKLNGKSLSILDCESQRWGSEAYPEVSSVTVKRGTEENTVSISLVPLRLLVENAWRGSIGMVVSNEKDTFIYEGTDTFTVGIRAARRGSRTMIVAILEGSPASRAGLEPGDELIMLNGTPVSALGDDVLGRAFSKLDPGSTFTIRRVSIQRNVNLGAEGLAQILTRVESKQTLKMEPTRIAQSE